jgi:hypothetical protein
LHSRSFPCEAGKSILLIPVGREKPHSNFTP